MAAEMAANHLASKMASAKSSIKKLWRNIG
jgi:hypothetical protein